MLASTRQGNKACICQGGQTEKSKAEKGGAKNFCNFLRPNPQSQMGDLLFFVNQKIHHWISSIQEGIAK
jgi:putative hemolysin